MDITHKALKRVDLVAVSGRVDSNTAPDLEATFRAINDEGRFRIVVDMSDLTFVSSAGLRVLVSSLKNCRRYNRGDLRLAQVPERINDVLEIAGLDAMFTTYADVAEAVGSF
jgi:anti-sigma B factor antagonist